MDTEWRAIPGYEGYEASSEGEIRPVNPRYTKGRGLILRPWTVDRHGRLARYVTLHQGGKRHKHLVHRLVALAFHGLPPAGKEDCCHVDHNALNNRASNLKWDSHSANIEDQWERRHEERIREDDALGVTPSYTGPCPGSDVPF